MNRIAAIVVAAGLGKRFGGNKTFENICGKPILFWSLAALNEHPKISSIFLVVNDKIFQNAKRLIVDEHFDKVKDILLGGEHRQDSVFNGLLKIDENIDTVLVHDCARPNISDNFVSQIIDGLKEYDGAVPAVDAKDTIKKIDGAMVVETVERSNYKMAQTPQIFKREILYEAHKRANSEGVYGTDDAFLLEYYGYTVGLISGDERNIKVTTSNDLELIKTFFKESGKCLE